MESRGSSDSEDDRIVHVREALMCPGGGCVPTLRTARFLNYTITAIDDDVFELPCDAFSSRPEAFEPEKWPVKFLFAGWGSPSVNWIEWVNAMAESHAPTWRKSGVHDAIMASRYQVKKHEDLMTALVEKWCIDTNSFVFPWGEATVTLEDMMVLGGFSAIGNYVFGSTKREEIKSVEEKLKRVKREFRANSGKKCCVGLWMKEFMTSNSEIEHEAFMVTWLSRFVFPDSADLVRDKLFAAAVQLARGVRLALAPAVLAGIYRDLGLLKERLAGYVQFGNVEEETLAVTSPFQFVQVWVWERIMAVRPGPGMAPNPLKPGEPRMARWHHHGGQDLDPKPENLRSVLDSAEESFDYRPYAKPLKNFKFPNFYLENDCWVSVDSSLDEDIISFARCLRFSKLVGLDCIEPYYPHRVAMQFGFDKDVPSIVPARVETPELAWKDYIRPISDGMLYIPSRLYEADVTYRYIGWWKQSVAFLQAAAKKSVLKVLCSPLKEKLMTTTTTAITMTTTNSSTGRLKTTSSKANGKDQETAKKVTETKGGKLFANSRIAVNRMKAGREGGGSLMGSEEAAKQSKGTGEAGSSSGDGKVLLKKTEGIKKSSPSSAKSLGRLMSDVKDLRGALKGSRETKGNSHVTFLLPGSSGSSPKLQTPPPKQSTKGSPIRTLKALPPAVGSAKQSSLPPRDPRQTSSVPPRGGKNETKNAISIPAREIASTKLRPAKEFSVSQCSPGSRPLRRARSLRSLEAEKSNESSSRGISAVKPNAEQSKAAKEESLKDIQATSEANKLKLLDQMVTLKQHIGEGGEVTYQIPKSQFEVLSQGFQDVLMELQTIKSALNIDKR